MNLFMQALLTSIVTWIGFLDKAFLHTFLYRPIVIGPLVGLVFGDLSMGLQVGVSVELMFLAVIFVGTAIPPDETISAVWQQRLRVRRAVPKWGSQLLCRSRLSDRFSGRHVILLFMSLPNAW